jgi:hypothetical protein
VTVPLAAPGVIKSESVTVRLGATTISLEPSLYVMVDSPPQFTAALALLTGMRSSETTKGTTVARRRPFFLDMHSM